VSIFNQARAQTAAPKRPAPKCPSAQTAAPERRRPNVTYPWGESAESYAIFSILCQICTFGLFLISNS